MKCIVCISGRGVPQDFWSWLVSEVYRSPSAGVDSAGVSTIFENRSGAGVDFFKEGPEPESVFDKRLLCTLLIIIFADCFLQSML